MKTIRNMLLIGLTALAVASAWAEDNKVVERDKAQLQGEWTLVSGERGGQAFSADYMKNSKRVAKGDETTVTIQGQLFMKARFTLDPSKSPKTIDYSVTDGLYAGNTQLGIYELDGDKVKYCFSVHGKERPTNFTTKPEDGRTLSVWKREQKQP